MVFACIHALYGVVVARRTARGLAAGLGIDAPLAQLLGEGLSAPVQIGLPRIQPFPVLGLGAHAQSLLALGTRVSTVNIRVADRTELQRTVDDMRGLVAAPGLSFAPWQELLPQLDEMVRFNRVVSNIVLAVFLLVVATAVTNTVFMAVAERTREFGVMMALGTPPGAIQRMVVYETLALMLLATLLGYGAGIALVQYLGRHGIDLSGFFRGYSTIPGLTGIVYPQVFAETVVAPGVALLVAGVLVSLYPAAKASRLDPARAIRHV